MSSEKFVISNDVRQGSALSPSLFGYYMDDLINVIAQRNIDCKVGNHFTGILMYAENSAACAMASTAVNGWHKVRTLAKITCCLVPTSLKVKLTASA